LGAFGPREAARFAGAGFAASSPSAGGAFPKRSSWDRVANRDPWGSWENASRFRGHYTSASRPRGEPGEPFLRLGPERIAGWRQPRDQLHPARRPLRLALHPGIRPAEDLREPRPHRLQLGAGLGVRRIEGGGLSEPLGGELQVVRDARPDARLDEARGGAPRKGGAYTFLGFVVDVARRQVRAPNGATILLTSGEFSLLNAFLDHPQRILSRDQLLEAARGAQTEVFDRAVDVQISRLRRKLHACSEVEIIKTVRGAGYMFEAKVMRP